MAKSKKKVIKKKQAKTVFVRSRLTLKSVGTTFKRLEPDLRLLLIPIILLVVLQILSTMLESVQVRTKQERVAAESAAAPVSSYTFFTQPITPPISAEAAIILDRDTKNILYEKNAHLRFSMASTTKVTTALVALDFFKPNSILTTYTSNVEGVNVGLQVGDRLYFKDALYAMLLPSGNDVALMIAQNFPGGADAFVKQMNEKAKSLHLTNTHYADPAGLNDDGNYTTAIELAELASVATQNQTLADVTATKSKIITTVDGTRTFTLTNLNKLLGIYGVTGVKTGHTEGAGDVLVTSAVAHSHTYIIVVMRSEDRFADTEVLLSYLNTGVTTFSPKNRDY